MKMTSRELRHSYINFFTEPPRNHKEIPTSPLVPEHDPTVLFTTAGMHPLIPYLLGSPHSLGRRLVDCQKCVRTDDIAEVGDVIHHTFFEMLGNWSLGDYFKKEAIAWSYEYLTKVLKLDSERLYITCFAGDADAPKDETSAAIWQSLGIPKERIFFYGKKENWWGPVGSSGPCGPDTEMHYDVTQKPHGPGCRPGDGCDRFSEIWNDVFMEYNRKADGTFEKLPKPNVDTGMGLERVLAVVNGLDDDYLTDLWQPAISAIAELSGKTYAGEPKAFRIVADHVRAAAFIITDGVLPSNKERGYILRRLIRRATLQMRQLECEDLQEAVVRVADAFINQMTPVYPEVEDSRATIEATLRDEVGKFQKTLERGLKEFRKIHRMDGKAAFDLYQSFGFPWELTAELAESQGQQIDYGQFKQEFEKHQELSRTASAGMFKGGLADHSETVTKYHTATHLLHAALRQTLGTHVHQEGSNITDQRLRFDFSHPVKLTEEELKKVENLVNEKITADLRQKLETLPYKQAIESGALAFFKERYPETVTVYSFGDFSREVCGGPHVASTGQIGRLKIIKTEKIASGIQRIYASLV